MALFSKQIRLQLLALFVVLAVGGLVARLWWVQVVKSDLYAQKIRGGSTVSVRIPSVRGEIRDRNGVTLVGNRASYQLEFYLPDMVSGYRRTLGSNTMPVIPPTHPVPALFQHTT